MASERNVDDANGEENESDADTDELVNTAEALCSGTSEGQKIDLRSVLVSDRTPLKASSSPKLVGSARRCLHFDSERKRGAVLCADHSRSCPSTPKSNMDNGKGIVSKLVSSPSTATDSGSSEVHLRFDHDGQLSLPFDSLSLIKLADNPDQAPVSRSRAESLRSLLSSAKMDLTNASRLIQRAVSPNGPTANSSTSTSSFATSLSNEERRFVERLSVEELRELYEVEFCKRRYCEKKIDILQKQLLDSEEKLSVATTTVEKYKTVVGKVEESCDDLINTVTTKEHENRRNWTIAKRSNEQMKETLVRLVEYAKTMGEKVEENRERARVLENELTEKSTMVRTMEVEMNNMKVVTERKQWEIERLEKKLSQCEEQRKAGMEREEQLTKEVLLMEKTIKENNEALQTVKGELNNERTTRKGQLEETEKQYRNRITELAKDFDSRVQKTRQEIEQRTTSEVKKLKDEWDSVLYGLTEKYSRMVSERDEALRRLKDYEETFVERQRVMCYELQQRLSSKYYELLSEFNAPGFASHGGGGGGNGMVPGTDYQQGDKADGTGSAGSHDQHDGGWLTMADEFADQLRKATGKNVANEGGQTKQINSNPTRGRRAVPPTDAHPTK